MGPRGKIQALHRNSVWTQEAEMKQGSPGRTEILTGAQGRGVVHCDFLPSLEAL